MTYAQSFDLATPTGLEEANTIDEIIRNVKIALNERFTDILGVDLSSATDPQRVTKIVIPSAGMTIRNSSDAASLISITNSGASLASPTITGTMTATGATISGGTVAPTTLTVPNGTAITNAALTTPALVSAVLTTPALVDAALSGTTVNSGTISGGTVSPTTLTVPSGTTIPTHTETGTITATGSTRNGGTIATATLNNTTFTGTVSGLSTNPTVYNTVNVSSVTLLTTPTTVATLNIPSAGTYLLLSSGYVGVSASSVAAERVSISMTGYVGGSSLGDVTQFLGVIGSTSANPVGYYDTFSMLNVSTFSAAGTVTVVGYKFSSGNIVTVASNSCTIVAIRVN
jgi:hypothetical protein